MLETQQLEDIQAKVVVLAAEMAPMVVWVWLLQLQYKCLKVTTMIDFEAVAEEAAVAAKVVKVAVVVTAVTEYVVGGSVTVLT
jgi:hypothetical protein